MITAFAKAAIYRPPHSDISSVALPRQFESSKCVVSRPHCLAYHRTVNWPLLDSGIVHPNYIQVLTLPMQLKLMSSAPFPFKTLGLVHLANKVDVNQLPKVGANLHLTCCFGNAYSHRKGVVFEMHSEASENGTLLVKATSFYLARTETAITHSLSPFDDTKLLLNACDYAGKRDDSNVIEDIASMVFSENIGRKYARVSGDYNPIHLWPVTSKPFGFRKAIAHGMFSNALALSIIQQKGASDLQKDCSIRAVFKQAIFLPSEPQLGIQTNNVNTDKGYFVTCKKPSGGKSRLHMLGTITPLQ